MGNLSHLLLWPLDSWTLVAKNENEWRRVLNGLFCPVDDGARSAFRSVYIPGLPR